MYKKYTNEVWAGVLDELRQDAEGAGDELARMLADGVWNRFYQYRLIPRVYSSCNRAWGDGAGAQKAALRASGSDAEIVHDAFSAFREGLLRDAAGRGGDVVRDWASKNANKRTDFSYYCLDKIRNKIDKEVRRLHLPLEDEDPAPSGQTTGKFTGSYDRAAAADSLLEIERVRLRPGTQYRRDLEAHMNRVKQGEDAVQPGDDRNRLKDLRKKLWTNRAVHKARDFTVHINEYDQAGNTTHEHIMHSTLDWFVCWERLYPKKLAAAIKVPR